LAYSQTFGQISEVFVPVVPEKAGTVPSLKVILASKRMEVLNAIKALKSGGDPADQTEASRNILMALKSQQSIEGVVRYGLASSERERAKLAAIIPGLDRDYVVIQEGPQPTIGEGLKEIGYGILLLIASGIIGNLAEKPKPPQLPPTPPPLPPGL
jgi:hypothetical protein